MRDRKGRREKQSVEEGKRGKDIQTMTVEGGKKRDQYIFNRPFHF